MKGFEFFAPASLQEALDLIDGKGRDYELLAGGTNLVPNIRDGSSTPLAVVDLGAVKTLRYIKEEEDMIKIGSLTTFSDILKSDLIKHRAVILREAVGKIAGPLIRNRATVGGNLVDASPAADSAVPLLALKAQLTLRSLKGDRTVPLARFFADYRKTLIEPGEILTEIVFPAPPKDSRFGYEKIGRRNAMAISVASVAVMLHMKEDTCTDACIALGAIAPTPIRLGEAEALLRDKVVNLDLAQRCGEIALKDAEPISDLRASSEYRRHVCDVLVRRTICRSLNIKEETS